MIITSMVLQNALLHNPIFVDTSGWIVIANPRDDLHEEASRLHRECRTRHRLLVITGFVMAETIAILLNALPHASMLRFVDSLRASRNVKILHVTEWLQEYRFDFFRHHSDKVWSLTDYISFLVMAELGLTDAFTHNHYFQQAGFRTLPR